jgi:hypothetical protein
VKPEVGQVWNDTYIENKHTPWTVRVMRLNRCSVRVEPCASDGWHTPAGYEWGYRLPYKFFENGRMERVDA